MGAVLGVFAALLVGTITSVLFAIKAERNARVALGEKRRGADPDLSGPPGRRGRGPGRTTTWRLPHASSKPPRRTCATPGNGATCAAGSTTVPSVIPLPAESAGLLTGAPDPLRAWVSDGRRLARSRTWREASSGVCRSASSVGGLSPSRRHAAD